LGGGITEEVLKFIKSREKLSKTVIVLGSLSIEASNYLIVNSLAGILPRLDGSSMKVIHYLMLGKPVIAKGTISNKELLKDGYNSYLYENKAELVNILDQINSSKEVLNKLKQGVKETANSIKENWNQSSFLKKYEI
jgi:glycosyltransferase involved in cell wall biosynthesis